jgi:DNA-binding GntR family transcriptional regulator
MEMQTPGTIPYYLQNRIRELIVDGTFKPGQPIREQDLEKRFGTSRSPIREALRLLEQGGLVTHAQRRGFRVTLYTEREIVDQYKLRAELEAYAIKLLAEVDDLEPLLQQLNAHHALLGQAYVQGDARGYLSEIRQFYGAIAFYTGNSPLCSVLSKLSETAEPMRYNLLSRKLGESKTMEYTYQIIEAISARQFKQAAKLKREHVLGNLDSILQAYAEAQYKEDGV